MTIANVELYDALIEAGASEDKALKAAASAVVSCRSDTSEIAGQLFFIKWMVGFNLAATMAVLWKILS